MMSRLDDILAHHGIDTTTCMQRVACSYSKQAAEAMRRSDNDVDSISTVDRFVDAVSSNPMLRSVLQGTAIQEAMQAGRKGQNCARAYHQCTFSSDTMLALLAKIAATTASATAKATAAGA